MLIHTEQKSNKLLFEDQQREFLSILKVNMEEEWENHEDNLRSEGKIEEPKEVEEVEEDEEVVKELDELEERSQLLETRRK